MAHTVFLLIAAVLAGATAVGFDTTLTPRLLEEALGIGQSRIESVRTRYHQRYRLQIARPPVDYIDVVTPFRRVVLITEERTVLGIRGFTQREAVAALGDRADVVELHVEMTFHPQNVFVGVPAYGVALVAASHAIRIAPRDVELVPRFGARVNTPTLSSPAGAPPNQPGGGGQPLTGGTIVAIFPVAALNAAGVYDAVVTDMGKELAKAPVNFGALR